MERDKNAQNHDTATRADALSGAGNSGIELSETELGNASGAASDIFAKIGDIKGESLDDKHRDEILSSMPKIPRKPSFLK